jgi:hypothetical protein
MKLSLEDETIPGFSIPFHPYPPLSPIGRTGLSLSLFGSLGTPFKVILCTPLIFALFAGVFLTPSDNFEGKII